MFEPLLLQPKLPNDIHSANDVLEDILDDVDGFPQAALEAAHHFQEELTPTLLEVLDDAIAHYAIATGDDFAPLYALYLLAKFRDTDAYPRLIEILRLPEDGAEIILGEDGLTGYGTVNLIISMFDGDIDVLLGLIEDCNANEFARATGIETLAALYSIQKLRREPLIDYFRRMLASPSTAKYTPFMRGIIASLVIDFNLTELVEVINSAFSNHLIDTEIVGDHKQFMEMMTTHPPLSAEAITKRYHVIEDLTAEMGWWACFHEKPEFFLEPVNVSQKIGRNAPCPCGSGLKYKRCCL